MEVLEMFDFMAPNITISDCPSLYRVSVTKCKTQSLSLEKLPVMNTIGWEGAQIGDLNFLNNMHALEDLQVTGSTISNLSLSLKESAVSCGFCDVTSFAFLGISNWNVGPCVQFAPPPPQHENTFWC